MLELVIFSAIVFLCGFAWRFADVAYDAAKRLIVKWKY